MASSGQIDKKTIDNVLSVVQLLNGPSHPRIIRDDLKKNLISTLHNRDAQPPYVNEKLSKAIERASALSNEKLFEGFNHLHHNYAFGLIEYFLNVSWDEFPQVVEYAYKYVNRYLVHYALSVALVNRKDAIDRRAVLPSAVVTQPEMFINMNKVITEAFLFENTDKKVLRVDIGRNFTATDKDDEHKIAYFREDIGMNLHHWHWHLVYPFEGPVEIVSKDRRGEIFYYMHQQMLARFNLERLSNNLPLARAFVNFREPMVETYFPKFGHWSNVYQIGTRPKNIALQDLNRENLFYNLNDMELWRDRILDAIDKGYAVVEDQVNGGEQLKKIDEVDGIDFLGNTIEAAPKLSWHFKYYGNFHNAGHMMIARAHDPDHRFQEPAGVMGYNETSAMDPIFYSWHSYINELCDRYKRTLPGYTNEQKQFDAIKINDVRILPLETESISCCDNDDEKAYTLKTFWEKDEVDVSNGLRSLQTDPEKKITIYGTFVHLQHEEFKYKIKVTNTQNVDKIGTVRIFLAPQKNDHKNEMTFNEQRSFFIELDKFTVLLPADDVTTIKRKSTESSVTIPFDRTFRTNKQAEKFIQDSNSKKSEDENDGFCGCGWPQHLLIGKGTAGRGLKCDLFIMITDYEQDKVDDSPLPKDSSEKKGTVGGCGSGCDKKTAFSYCGVRDKKYPDKRPMGFPFDREFKYESELNLLNTATLDDFMKKLDDQGKPTEYFSNMKRATVYIKHVEGQPKDGPSMKKSYERC